MRSSLYTLRTGALWQLLILVGSAMACSSGARGGRHSARSLKGYVGLQARPHQRAR
jgi:hypothetical protein